MELVIELHTIIITCHVGAQMHSGCVLLGKLRDLARQNNRLVLAAMTRLRYVVVQKTGRWVRSAMDNVKRIIIKVVIKRLFFKKRHAWPTVHDTLISAPTQVGIFEPAMTLCRRTCSYVQTYSTLSPSVRNRLI
jgi:hypothetical protein